MDPTDAARVIEQPWMPGGGGRVRHYALNYNFIRCINKHISRITVKINKLPIAKSIFDQPWLCRTVLTLRSAFADRDFIPKTRLHAEERCEAIFRNKKLFTSTEKKTEVTLKQPNDSKANSHTINKKSELEKLDGFQANTVTITFTMKTILIWRKDLSVFLKSAEDNTLKSAPQASRNFWK